MFTALLREMANAYSILNLKCSLHSYLWDVKHNSLTIYDSCLGNLLHTLKKFAKTEAGTKLAIEV